jgi:predicted aconitase with swiveling domain
VAVAAARGVLAATVLLEATMPMAAVAAVVGTIPMDQGLISPMRAAAVVDTI